MNKPVKATLLFALVFPGAGHFYLKKNIAGAVLAGVAFVALTIVLVEAVQAALQIARSIQSGEVQLDLASIAELITYHASGNEAQVASIATTVLFMSWLIGMVDAYRAGRAQEQSQGDGG